MILSSAQTTSPGGVTKTQRQLEKEKRREQLLAAAGRLFAERGFASVSLDEIGAEVGVTGQAIYRHFESKQDMLGALIGQAGYNLLLSGRAIETYNPDTYERLQQLVELQTDLALTSPVIGRESSRG